MPTYEYECTACGVRREVVQRFSDDALTTCEKCGGALRKVFSAVGVVFKGSGFYKTDSRSTNTAGAAPATAPSSGDSPSPATPSTPSTPATASTPSAATPAASSSSSD
jgi:putative FmdB family regulatory protein